MARSNLVFLVVLLGGFLVQGATSSSTQKDALQEKLEKAGVRSLVIAGPDTIYGKYTVTAPGPDDIQPVYSVTKTILALLVGMALHEDTLHVIFSSSIMLSEKKLPTIQQMLTMTAGYDWHEWNDWGNASKKIKAQKNWTTFFSSRQRLPNADERVFSYDSGSAHIMAAVLANAVGDPEKYLGEKLFAPLGITRYSWQKSPEGIPYGGSGIFMRPVDLIKIGQLFLNQGRWKGKQIVPSSWLAEMTKAQVPAAKVEAFFSSQAKGENRIDTCGYGYFVWVRDQYYFAMGYGGQLLIVLPKENLTVAMTGTAYRDSVGALDLLDDIIAVHKSLFILQQIFWMI